MRSVGSCPLAWLDTRAPRARLGLTTLAALVCAVVLGGCDRAPSPTGLKEWSPSDHEQPPGRPAPANQGARAADAGGTPALVEVAWRNQCATCHGLTGHGDGPQGPMFKAQDLTKEDVQARLKDDEIASVIKNGKGRMPKFDLPDEVVTGLVARVRSFRGK